MSNPLRLIDLNLLPILDALLSTGSVTGAADRLNLSQPATSQALSRLRNLLGDPLLVRSGRGMRLTTRAMALRAPVATACRDLLGLLGPDDFAPSRLQRTFTVATPDYCAFLLLRELLPVLNERAPGVEVRLVDASPTTPQQMANGDIDLAVMARMPDFDTLSARGGFFEDYVGLVASSHPLAASKRIRMHDLSPFQRVGINHNLDLRPFASENPQGSSIRVAPSHLLVLPLLVESLGVVAILTRALARIAQELTPAVLLEIEDAGPPLEICLAWDPLYDEDKAHTWLRGLVAQAAARIFRFSEQPPT